MNDSACQKQMNAGVTSSILFEQHSRYQRRIKNVLNYESVVGLHISLRLNVDKTKFTV